MAGPPPYFKMNQHPQVRIKVLKGSCNHAGDGLINDFNAKSLYNDGYWAPNFDLRMIIFKFLNDDHKKKLLDHPELNDILTKHKCALHVGQPSTTIEKSYRTVFVWNLNPVNLYLLTTADGIDADETLLDKMNLMKDDLASSLQARGMEVEEIHLAQKDPNRRPTTMKIRCVPEDVLCFWCESVSTLTS